MVNEATYRIVDDSGYIESEFDTLELAREMLKILQDNNFKFKGYARILKIKYNT